MQDIIHLSSIEHYIKILQTKRSLETYLEQMDNDIKIPNNIDNDIRWIIKNKNITKDIENLGEIKIFKTFAKNTIAEGEGLSAAEPGQPSFFTIYARDNEDRQRDAGGDHFHIEFQNQFFGDIKIKIEDTETGIYRVSYVLPYEAKGEGDMHITLLGIPIQGSPFRVTVGKFILRFDPATAANCVVSGDRTTATRLTSYDSTVRGDLPLPVDCFIRAKLTSANDETWVGSLGFGVIPKRVAISSKSYHTPEVAWAIDIDNGKVRSPDTELKVSSLKGTSVQKSFSENCEGRIIGLRFKAGDNGQGGTLNFYLDDKLIEGATLTIPLTYLHSDLVPFFGIYGRCKAVQALN